MRLFGIVGFLAPWALSELLQLFYLLHLNDRLFSEEAVLDRRPVYVLIGLLSAGTVAVLWPVYHLQHFSYPVQLSFAAIATLLALALSYRLFRLDEIRSLLWQRLVMRFPALASRRS
jgi:hypothetical protein